MKILGVAEQQTILCHLYKTNFLSKSRVTLAIKAWCGFCDLYAHAQPIFLLCCKFQIIILKTVEVAETRILPCHVYKTNFLSKSRVCNSYNNNLIRILWPLCTCSVDLLTMMQISNITLKTVEGVAETQTGLYREIDGQTHKHTDGQTDGNQDIWLRVKLYALLYFMMEA